MGRDRWGVCGGELGLVLIGRAVLSKSFLKLMLSNCVLEKTLESSLDFKETQPVHPKGNHS